MPIKSKNSEQHNICYVTPILLGGYGGSLAGDLAASTAPTTVDRDGNWLTDDRAGAGRVA